MTHSSGHLVELSIEGMHCSACVARVEKVIKQNPGVQDAGVSLLQKAGWIELAASGSANVPAILDKLKRDGYPAHLRTPNDDDALTDLTHSPPASRPHKRWGLLALLAGICSALVMALMFIHSSASVMTQLALASLCVCMAVPPIIKPGIIRLYKLRPDMFSLMAAGILVSYIAACISAVLVSYERGFAALAHLGHGQHAAQSGVLPLYLDTTCAIIALAALGRWLEARTLDKAARSIRYAADELPHEAIRVIAERQIETASILLRPGDRILCPVGSQVATDGTIEIGHSELDESLLTGEAMPLSRGPGERVLGGSINRGPQPLTILVTAKQTESFADSLERLMLEGQRSKTSAEKLTDRVSSIFVPIVLALAAIALLGWWLIARDLSGGIRAMTAVLVAACPCALGLAVPMTMTAASGALARKGLLLTDAAALEKARDLRTIALDKTGTLSLPRPIVTDAQGDTRTLAQARSICRQSLHPVAQAIAASGESLGTPTNITEQAGLGIHATIDGIRMTIRRGEPSATDIGSQTIVEVESSDGPRQVGSFTLQAPLKPNARDAITRLQRSGLHCILISGDQEPAVKAAATELGMTEFYSEVKPQDKLRLIQELTAKHPGTVAMAGDGINDAAALAAADVGVAMGTGSDLAKRAGHLIVLHDDPSAIADAIELSRQIMRRIRLTLALAFVYNIILLPIAALGLLNPVLAAGAMALSSVSVITGAMLGWPKSTRPASLKAPQTVP